MSQRFFEDYLGEAVYVYVVSWGDVVLYTSDGIQETNRIILEPVVLDAFFRWVERVKVETARTQREARRAPEDVEGDDHE